MMAKITKPALATFRKKEEVHPNASNQYHDVTAKDSLIEKSGGESVSRQRATDFTSKCKFRGRRKKKEGE